MPYLLQYCKIKKEALTFSSEGARVSFPCGLILLAFRACAEKRIKSDITNQT